MTFGAEFGIKAWDDRAHIVGQVRLSDTVLPSHEEIDPPGTYRGHRGRIEGVAFIPAPLAHSAIYFIILHPWVDVRCIPSLADLADLAPGDPLPENDDEVFLAALPPEA